MVSQCIIAQEPRAPSFDLHTADGLVASGPLEELRDDWSVAVGGEPPRRVRGVDLVSLRRARTPLPPSPHEEHLVLANGDRLPCTPVRLAGERLRIETHLGSAQQLDVPLEALALVWFAAPDGAEDHDRLRRRLAAERRRTDAVLFRNRDVVEGTLTGLDADKVTLETGRNKTVDLERGRVAVVALSPESSRVGRARAPYARAVLANGARLSLASAHTDGPALLGKTLFGAAVRIPLEMLVALDVYQGRAVYLSELKPKGYQYTPYLGVAWPYTADASVVGRDLRLAGSTFDRGVGMHSEARLTYDLGGGFRWFDALVGLDELSGREGSVRVEVLVDGKPHSVGGELTGRDRPRPVRLAVDGARELTLVVRFGERGDVQDHVDWADARLIK